MQTAKMAFATTLGLAVLVAGAVSYPAANPTVSLSAEAAAFYNQPLSEALQEPPQEETPFLSDPVAAENESIYEESENAASLNRDEDVSPASVLATDSRSEEKASSATGTFPHEEGAITQSSAASLDSSLLSEDSSEKAPENSDTSSPSNAVPECAGQGCGCQNRCRHNAKTLVWVVDQPAWDEEVVVGELITCPNCGETLKSIEAYENHWPKCVPHGGGGICHDYEVEYLYETVHHEETGHWELA